MVLLYLLARGATRLNFGLACPDTLAVRVDWHLNDDRSYRGTS